ncbi:MAG TPA: carboxymuconolactone decarboxylase family protein [Dehalococcoidia bacterium]|nr:carboxymuconolactone decarboxylase family protein [Dehalococcoidia bacterium]
MPTLDERFQRGQDIRESMAAGDPTHFTVPGIDQLAPDLKRIIDEALFGSIWDRPALDIKNRCICTLSALMAMGQLPLLRRHIERSLHVGLTPSQVVEVFIQLTFYVGVPSVEAAMRMTKEIFEERGVEFTPTRVFDTHISPDELNQIGIESHREHMGDITIPETADDPNSPEMQLERLINEYHWGAIYTRPHLDAKARAICALSSMTVLGRYDRQLRRRISGALRVGMTPEEIMEVFIQLSLYGGYFTTRTAMQIARSVFTEEGVAV